MTLPAFTVACISALIVLCKGDSAVMTNECASRGLVNGACTVVLVSVGTKSEGDCAGLSNATLSCTLKEEGLLNGGLPADFTLTVITNGDATTFEWVAPSSGQTSGSGISGETIWETIDGANSHSNGQTATPKTLVFKTTCLCLPFAGGGAIPTRTTTPLWILATTPAAALPAGSPTPIVSVISPVTVPTPSGGSSMEFTQVASHVLIDNSLVYRHLLATNRYACEKLCRMELLTCRGYAYSNEDSVHPEDRCKIYAIDPSTIPLNGPGLYDVYASRNPSAA